MWRYDVLSAEEAARMISPGDTITVSGLGGNMVPEHVLEALEARFLATGEPGGLTEIHPWLYGSEDGTGLNRWAHPGFLKRIIGSTYILPSQSKTAEINRLILSEGVEAYCWPANAIFQMLRAVGSRRAGYLTEIGVDTFADPRRDGGGLNARSPKDLIELVVLAGREHLFYPSIPIDIAVIRASTADTEGNLFCEEEGLTQGICLQATAAHNSGGKVIAQVRRIVEAGTMHPMMVEVPGVLVDAVVVYEEGKQFEYGPSAANLATTGAYRLPYPTVQPRPLDTTKVMGRRAMMDVAEGEVINVGGGVPLDSMLPLSVEEDIDGLFHWTVEHGAWGGRCLGATHWNPTAIVSPGWLLDFYNGGGIDRAFLAMGELDQAGNVNVGRLRDQLPGPGGFTDIAESTGKVTFCGTMTSGGLEVDIVDGGLRIRREGAIRKFVPQCQMVCFSGRKALERGHSITYVTERAVFKLEKEGIVLEEVASGIDLQSQVMDLADFPILVSRNLRPMDSRLFQDKPLGRSKLRQGPLLAGPASLMREIGQEVGELTGGRRQGEAFPGHDAEPP